MTEVVKIFVTEVGEYMHSCEGDLVCKNVCSKVPYFNAPIYLENKSQIGKIDEIFGQVNSNVSLTKFPQTRHCLPIASPCGYSFLDRVKKKSFSP